MTIGDLAALLRQVRARADNPSLRDLERTAHRAGRSLPRSSVADMLAGKRLPRQQLMVSFLQACGLDPATDPRWAAAWNTLASRTADPHIDRRAPFDDDLIGDLRAAGLTRIGTTYMTGLQWSALFAEADEVDIYVAYAQTWTRMVGRDLALLAARPGARIRVVLADPDDEFTVSLLAYRFAITAQELRRRIHTTRDDYRALRTAGGADIDLRYRAGDRTFSLYRFGEIAVVCFYSHTRSRTANVPVLVCRRPGALFDFATEEWAAVLRGSRPA